MHHKLIHYRDNCYPLVEVFRKGDPVDFSLGMLKSGLPKTCIRSNHEQILNAGFYKRRVLEALHSPTKAWTACFRMLIPWMQ
jgi:hypothetical protein